MTRSTSPFRIPAPANDIRRHALRRQAIGRRIGRALAWLAARDDAGERQQVAFCAVAALVLILLIAGVKP